VVLDRQPHQQLGRGDGMELDVVPLERQHRLARPGEDERQCVQARIEQCGMHEMPTRLHGQLDPRIQIVRVAP
jgi:hypothetical protein